MIDVELPFLLRCVRISLNSFLWALTSNYSESNRSIPIARIIFSCFVSKVRKQLKKNVLKTETKRAKEKKKFPYSYGNSQFIQIDKRFSVAVHLTAK